MRKWRPTITQRILGGLTLAVGLFIAAIALPAVLPPGRYEVAPRWEVQLVDESGKPVPEAKILQGFSYFYGTRSTSRDEELPERTNPNGVIMLPRRELEISRRTVWRGRLLGLLNVHSSYGPSSTVFASAEGFRTEAFWLDPKEPVVDGVRHSSFKLHRN
jgi:hypothetical protein